TDMLPLDSLTPGREWRKSGVVTLQGQQREAQSVLVDVRKQAQADRGRLSSLETLQNAALGQEDGAALGWLKARGLDSATRVGEALVVAEGWENAVETALGQIIEGALVDSPEALVDAIGALDQGRLTLVAAGEEPVACAPTSLAAKVHGPAAVRRLLMHLHAAEDLVAARTMLSGLGDGESVITRGGERLGAGWVRVVRSGAAKQGALLREKEIQSLRSQIEALQEREHELESSLTRLREQALAAEQQREEAQRALYAAHRSVSELAGRLQSQQ